MLSLWCSLWCFTGPVPKLSLCAVPELPQCCSRGAPVLTACYVCAVSVSGLCPSVPLCPCPACVPPLSPWPVSLCLPLSVSGLCSSSVSVACLPLSPSVRVRSVFLLCLPLSVSGLCSSSVSVASLPLSPSVRVRPVFLLCLRGLSPSVSLCPYPACVPPLSPWPVSLCPCPVCRCLMDVAADPVSLSVAADIQLRGAARTGGDQRWPPLQ